MQTHIPSLLPQSASEAEHIRTRLDLSSNAFQAAGLFFLTFISQGLSFTVVPWSHSHNYAFRPGSCSVQTIWSASHWAVGALLNIFFSWILKDFLHNGNSKVMVISGRSCGGKFLKYFLKKRYIDINLEEYTNFFATTDHMILYLIQYFTQLTNANAFVSRGLKWCCRKSLLDKCPFFFLSSRWWTHTLWASVCLKVICTGACESNLSLHRKGHRRISTMTYSSSNLTKWIRGVLIRLPAAWWKNTLSVLTEPWYD